MLEQRLQSNGESFCHGPRIPGVPQQFRDISRWSVQKKHLKLRI